MGHNRGRRKPQHNYINRSRGGEAPSGSNGYPASLSGHRDPYYAHDYSYRPEDPPYTNATPTYPPQDYTHSAPWPYEQQRMDYDPRQWREEEERRRTPVYEDYHGYRADSSSYSGPRNDEWHDYERQHYSNPYPYAQPQSHYSQSQYSNYSSQGLSNYDGYSSSSYRDYQPSNGAYSDYRHMPDPVYHDRRRDYEGYSDYRRPPPAAMEYQQPPSYPNYRRRSASPPSTYARGFASQARAPIKPVLFQSAPIIRPPSPPRPPKRTEPTEEYLAVSLQPSPRISDPADARKLIVLDLNGSLVLRSTHSRRVPPPRRGGPPPSGPYDPYADPTQLRPLRTVHRRPYLSSFTAYLLHDQTKKWLDTMVWSSAQPHSVADMVEHCFGDRKSELKAVWARDTLGLTADEYHKKSLTLKDLEKPWAELPLTQSTDLQPSSSAVANKSPSSHSALTTLLVDDSHAKAALQPWNHLCIRDYVQTMRNMDLLIAEREARNQSKAEGTPKPTIKIEQEVAMVPPANVAPPTGTQQAEPSTSTPQHTASTTESDTHPVQKVTREVVMVRGELVGRKEEVVKKVIREVVMIDGQMVNPDESSSTPGAEPPPDPNVFVPNQKRKAKRLAKKENARLAREEKEREAFLSLRAQLHGTPAAAVHPNPNTENAEQASEVQTQTSQADDAEIRYDETLLAVIGVLDHVKHEGNVAGWLRSGGLLRAVLPKRQPPSSEQPTLAQPTPAQAETSRKHGAPSRGQSPSENENPTKKTKLSTGSEREDPASSSLPTPPLTSQTTEFAVEEQASTGVPLSSPVPGSLKQASGATTLAGLWYEDPVVMHFWADRGRNALNELGIKVESGMVMVPEGA